MSNPPEWYRTTTLIGGTVEATVRAENSSGYLPEFAVIRLAHEDGFLEFTEDQASDLVGLLSLRLTEVRRARHLATLDRVCPE